MRNFSLVVKCQRPLNPIVLTVWRNWCRNRIWHPFKNACVKYVQSVGEKKSWEYIEYFWLHTQTCKHTDTYSERERWCELSATMQNSGFS